jgi:hypothetical protein
MTSIKILTNLIQLTGQFGNDGFQPPTDAYTEGADTNPGLIKILATGISNVIGILTTLAGLFFILNFFLGAVGWITAGDDTGKAEKARTRIMNAVVGLVIVVASYGVIGLIGSMIGIDFINIGEILEKIHPGNLVDGLG